MAASMIPPPIVQSTYAGPARPAQKSAIKERPALTDDRQSEIEADLQFLLDAQAEGLLRGLESKLQDDQISTGSTTPTAQSVRSASTRRSPRPARRRPGLRSARKGIFNSIVALAAVKSDELDTMDFDVEEKDSALHQIDEWEHKRQKLQDATKAVDGSETIIRAQRVRHAADQLQADINRVRMELESMEVKHRNLMRQAAALENAAQAKLASYTSSLSMLEADVQQFLSLRTTNSALSSGSRDERSSMSQLPAKRRNLTMAREHYNAEKEAVLGDRREIEREKAALDEGAVVWKEVVAQVSDFERLLRGEMAGLSTLSDSNSAWDESPHTAAPERLKDVLAQLDNVLDGLEVKFKLAEERDWKLLIAAIGAELDALRQGKQILQDVLGVPDDMTGIVDGDGTANGGGTADDGKEIHELDRSFETARKRGSSDSEDDPDPELMFSTRDDAVE